MPHPSQNPPPVYPSHMQFARMPPAKDGAKPVDFLREIAALREEIAALRADLAPVPSLIVTGRQALDEFKALASKTPA